MIALDTNLLFEACEASTARHAKALAFLRDQADNRDLAICELVLSELYVLLRNPALSRKPLKALDAAAIIQSFRNNAAWRLIDYPGSGSDLADRLWVRMAQNGTPYRAIFDTRLALTLRHHGVTEFATRNIKDFQDYGFARVWDPLA